MTNSASKWLRWIAAGALLAPAFACAPAGFADAGEQDIARAKSTVIFAGFDAREKTYYPYAGLIHHFSGDLVSDSWLLRIFGFYSDYSYTTPAVTTGKVDANAAAFDITAGYQKALRDFTIRGFAGLDYEDDDLSPDNPFDPNRGSDFGVRIQGEIETNFTSKYYGSLISTYGTAKDRHWTRLRGGYDFGDFIVGPEGLITGDDAHDEQRGGAFVLLWPLGPVAVSFSGGYSHTDDNRGGSSPYGTVELSTAFGLLD